MHVVRVILTLFQEITEKVIQPPEPLVRIVFLIDEYYRARSLIAFPVLLFHEDPNLEKERLYRWLKRKFIDLVGLGRDEPSLSTKIVMPSADLPPTTRPRARANDMFITWDRARDILHRAPHNLGELVAIDLPRLSRDMWSEDLEDAKRTMVSPEASRGWHQAAGS